ncbi:unnamed protein product [Rotaria socialis]|uniref:Ubiquinone biosynthesis protein n=4 Tax=Rotaria socialis TaxID=392032 RepID=A0A818X237_9BILA|nr:unnamed protein product [Rotaria socialis]CAF4447122.1 unnamed protein product [Rotaria socialis]
MQRLMYISSGRSRLLRVIAVNYKLLFVKEKLINNLILKRSITTENNSPEKINASSVHANHLHETSALQKEVCVSDDHKGKQSSESFPSNTTIACNQNVWSPQSPHIRHSSPLTHDNSITSIATPLKHNKNLSETEVYTTPSELNTTNPLKKTHSSQSKLISVKLAEAAATSAFKQYAPSTPLTLSTTETVFAPKISSTETYSKSSSLSTDFDSSISLSSATKKIKYETKNQSEVSGGQDTSGEIKIRPTENSFDKQLIKNQYNFSDNSSKIPIQSESDIRNDILRESLIYVHEKGWTMEAIRAGIKKCNQPETAEGLFYNSYDLVDHFMRDSNAKMTAYMNDMANKEDIDGNRLLLEGLKYRLKLVIPYADTWEQALAQKGLPPNAKRAWKSLLDLANNAWFSIGDTATDMKWYTKRISIATIYRSAEIYMLRDQSPDKIESMNFLERHLGDFETMSTVRRSVSQSMSDTVQVASGLLTVVRTMTNRHK